VRRAIRAQHRRLERRRQASRPKPAVHRVERGESLWAIARARLGARATNAEVAALVGRVWEANEHVLPSGDPDLIYPGERLELPR
jgi:nucleoid-associated protein YgaU